MFREKGRCETCHPLVDYPGHDRYAPSLLAGAGHSAEYLRESILKPNDTIVPGYGYSLVLTKTGDARHGRILSRSDASIVLAEGNALDGTVTTIPASKIATERPSTVSPMPPYEGMLSEDELRDLVAFLEAISR